MSKADLPACVRLDGGGDTAVFDMRSGASPVLVYWGAALPGDEDLGALAALATPPVPQGGLDDGDTLSWVPETGRGFSGHPGLSAHRAGQLVLTQFVVSACEPSAGTCRIELEDQAAGLRLSLTLAMDDGTGVLSSRVTLTNDGAVPLTVDWLASGTLPSPFEEILHFGGRWAHEFSAARTVLKHGQLVSENRSGRTSHHAPPFMIAGSAGFGEARGEVVGIHLGWSGGHRLIAERLRDGRIQLQAGLLPAAGEICLARGEWFEAPVLYAARSEAGLNGLSARLHDFVRRQIVPDLVTRQARPVHFNTWEATYFDLNEASMMALATEAAAIGIERFVLDDGWFRGRHNDRAGLGDWTPDPVKYPRGLQPLIAHVKQAGMRFGLWVEPEMANADSDLLRAHPDWTLGDPERQQPLGRGQSVLDLTRREVAGAIFSAIDRLLTENEIDYLKWDMNRDLTHPVSAGRAATIAQTRAVYAMIDGLRARHPGVEIESCASGGGRADYEILKRTTRIWTSDCNDPVDRQAIQRAASIFFPPEIMGAHVGPAESHTTARVTSLALRAFTAMGGHFGVEADIRTMPAEDRAALSGTIALHKSLRAHLHGARLIRLEHLDAGCLAVMQGDGSVWLVTAAQVETPPFALMAPLRLAGLDAADTYRVQLLNPPPHPRASMKRRTPLIRGEAIHARGLALMKAGLHLPPLRAGEIAALKVERLTRTTE
jgi:alpha-galactosidase